jgi:two-component system response regulator HydG
MKSRILIVDDDRDHAESVADLLDLRGYQVELAFTGEQALRRFSEVDFDVTIMDVQLPGMNGVETFFQFRKARPQARVIMMTGFSVEQLVAQAIEGGALGILHKPFATTELLTAIEQARPRGMILVVDDDPEFSASAADLLGAEGYRVSIAGSVEEALHAVGSAAVDCLIVDPRLSVLSGIKLCWRLRELGQAIPIVLVASRDDGEKRALPRRGTEHLLIKPIQPEELLAAVKNALDSRHVHSE